MRQIHHRAVVVELRVAVVGFVEVDIGHSQIRDALLIVVRGAGGYRLLEVPQRVVVAHLVVGDAAQSVVNLVEILGVLVVLQHLCELALQGGASARLAVEDAGFVDARVENILIIRIFIDNLLIPVAGVAVVFGNLVNLRQNVHQADFLALVATDCLHGRLHVWDCVGVAALSQQNVGLGLCQR